MINEVFGWRCFKWKFTWNILAPYGVRHAFSKLSLPVETNHLPQVAKRNESTQLSCNNNWYLSGLLACNTSTCEFSIPTANQSPVEKKLTISLCFSDLLDKKCPPTSWTVSQREDLGTEIMLLQLATLSQVPWTHGIVQAACPQTITIWADVDARCTVSVALELSHKRLIVKIPNGNMPVAAAWEANLWIWTDCQSIASRRRRCKFSFNSRRRTCQVPNGKIRCFTWDQNKKKF